MGEKVGRARWARAVGGVDWARTMWWWSREAASRDWRSRRRWRARGSGEGVMGRRVWCSNGTRARRREGKGTG